MVESILRRAGPLWITWLLLFGILSLGVSRPAAALTVGSQAPQFVLPTLEGKRIALADVKGRFALLKIGTTWCGGCQVLEGELAKLNAFMTAERIHLLEVFVGEGADAVREHVRGRGAKSSVTVLLGDDRFYRDYGVYLIPRLLLLDPEQKIVFDSGAMGAEEIKVRYLQTKGSNGRK